MHTGHERRPPPLSAVPLLFWLTLFTLHLLLSG